MFHVWGRILGFTIFLSSFFLKLSSKNRSSLLGSEPIALAILAAGPSNLSESFTELELLFRDSLSFFALTLETDPGLQRQTRFIQKTIECSNRHQIYMEIDLRSLGEVGHHATKHFQLYLGNTGLACGTVLWGSGLTWWHGRCAARPPHLDFQLRCLTRPTQLLPVLVLVL